MDNPRNANDMKKEQPRNIDGLTKEQMIAEIKAEYKDKPLADVKRASDGLWKFLAENM